MSALPNSFTDREVFGLVTRELSQCLGIPETELVGVGFCSHPEHGEFALNVGRLFSRLSAEEKKGNNPPKYAATLAEKVEASANRDLILSASATGAFLNVKTSRARIFKLVVDRVLEMGEKYGSSTQPVPKKVIIEHTSCNPNSPLHVGNLRNVMIGAHLARLMRFCGCDVKEYFFVNDLGGQIGLTVLGYSRLDRLPEGMKIDHVIGSVYAIMNTFNEAQKKGFKLSEFNQAVLNAPPEPEASKPAESEEQPKPEEQGKKKPRWAGKEAQAELSEEEKAAIAEKEKRDLVGVGASLLKRFPQLYNDLFSKFTDDDCIQTQGAALNKAYENRDPEAVKIFRKMVCDTLSGQQATLDIYGVHHDQFDFESELSWEGTSDALINLFKQSAFFHPQTQCNEQGKPQGAYLDIDSYLDAIKAKRGKGGYNKPYPPFYVLRPDGTTLYTLRDVAYSMKKVSQADMVLNVICTEQNLPQEKVMLTMKALGVKERKQFHMAYELVKLFRGKEIVRMSGRKGLYVLADELYDMIKDKTAEVMKTTDRKHVDDDDTATQEKVCHTVATAAMKYSLLCVSTRLEINFDINEAVNAKGNSAAFILYAGARISSIINKYEQGIKEGKWGPEPAEVDWSLLTEPAEWEILTKYVMPFARLICDACLPEIPPEPRLPEFGTHVIPQFAFTLAGAFSTYYSKVKILNGEPSMYTRNRFCRAVLRVIHNALHLFMVDPLESM